MTDTDTSTKTNHTTIFFALPPEMVPLPKAPAVFELSRSCFYRLAGAGKIRLVKMGNRTLVDAASVRAFVATLPEAQIRGIAA